MTGLLRHSTGGDRLVGWPAGMRILVRREEIEHGTQLSLFEQLAGYRYQVLATSTAGGQPQRLEARHRVHARVEGFIRTGKDTGLARWPSHSFAINTAWVTAVAIAIDLLCWMRLLLLDGPPADPPNLALGTRIRRRPQQGPRHTLTHRPLCPLDPKKGVTTPGIKDPASPHDTRRRRLPPASKPRQSCRPADRHSRTRATVKF
ncbi:transposase [Mycobacterium servetii]|uniref:Transposase n=1 Tax=Mycobacterium servetii TaxID=3237418 RepID=A0ABV4C0Y3_9MYCO